MANPFFVRDYTDIARSDHSSELREGVRAFWAPGEQLWDADMNNTMRFFRVFGYMVVDYRKARRPPLFRPVSYSYIALSGAKRNTIQIFTGAETVELHPFAGLVVYIEADKEFIVFDGAEWRPFLISPQPPCVELTFFMSDVFARATAASHVVKRPFKILKSPRKNKCRARGIPLNCQLLILKNGEVVGAIRGEPSVTSFAFPLDVDFGVGDVLSIKGADRSFRSATVTIYGELV